METLEVIQSRIKEIDKKIIENKERAKTMAPISPIDTLFSKLFDEDNKKYKNEFEKRQEFAAIKLIDKHYTSYNFDEEDKKIMFSEFLRLFYAREVKGFLEYMRKNGYKTDFQLNRQEELKNE